VSDVYKVIWLVRFNEGMAREDAVRHWREVHGPLGVAVPGMQRYVQNLWLRPVGEYSEEPGPVEFDGHSECWFQSEDAFRAAMESPEWAAMVADAPNFFSAATMVGAVVDEHVMV
jgi:uncharacterized protein (TIGR02118 family)